MAGLGQGMNAMKSMGGNWKRPALPGPPSPAGPAGPPGQPAPPGPPAMPQPPQGQMMPGQPPPPMMPDSEMGIPGGGHARDATAAGTAAAEAPTRLLSDQRRARSPAPGAAPW